MSITRQRFLAAVSRRDISKASAKASAFSRQEKEKTWNYLSRVITAHSPEANNQQGLPSFFLNERIVRRQKFMAKINIWPLRRSAPFTVSSVTSVSGMSCPGCHFNVMSRYPMNKHLCVPGKSKRQFMRAWNTLYQKAEIIPAYNNIK